MLSGIWITILRSECRGVRYPSKIFNAVDRVLDGTQPSEVTLLQNNFILPTRGFPSEGVSNSTATQIGVTSVCNTLDLLNPIAQLLPPPQNLKQLTLQHSHSILLVNALVKTNRMLGRGSTIISLFALVFSFLRLLRSSANLNIRVLTRRPKTTR